MGPGINMVGWRIGDYVLVIHWLPLVADDKDLGTVRVVDRVEVGVSEAGAPGKVRVV